MDKSNYREKMMAQKMPDMRVSYCVDNVWAGTISDSYPKIVRNLQKDL